MKTKEFNLEEALANPDLVVCRDGVKPEEWHYFKTYKATYNLYFIIDGVMVIAADNGKHYKDGKESNYDLFLLVKTKKVYKNVYREKYDNKTYLGPTDYETEEEAIKEGDCNEYVTTIEIEIPE